MFKLFASLAAFALVSAAAPASAQSREDQQSAREEMRAGRNLPVREIERRVVPQMRGHEYLTLEYDAASSAYRLKFLKEGRVVWVDVDARTARILQIHR